MNKITKEMLKIYKPISNLDWMNYKLIRSEVTFHHIIKAEYGGKKVITNGALLMPVALAHQYLHLIEHKDINTYVTINKLFKYINEQECEPTMEQREIIEYLLQEFEKVHRWDKSSKGKLLVQRKYLKREHTF